MSTERENPYANYPWVEYAYWARKYVVVPQILSMYLTGPNSPRPIKVVEHAGKDRPDIFIYTDGIYTPMSWSQLRGYVKGFMPPELRIKRNVDDVVFELETERSCSIDIFNSDEDIVNFNNGLFHLSTGELTPHTSEILSTVRIPCNYDSTLTLEKDAPTFSQFLDELVSEDPYDRSFLLEFMGAVISNVPGYKFKKCAMLVGPGNTGKSQLRQLLISLIGEQNNQAIEISKLNDRFSTSQLYQKRLAGSGDVSFVKVQEMSVVKNLTGGDTINAELKGKDAFSYKYRGYLLFNANELPAFGGDRGQHVYDRFCIVQCNNVIPPEKQNHHLLEEMLSEKDAIASVALKYLSYAIKRGYVFTEGESMCISRETYMRRNNSLIVFVQEACEMGGKMKRSEFRRVYVAWCKAEGMYQEADRNIDTVLKETFNIVPVKSSDVYYPLTVKYEVMEYLNFPTDKGKRGNKF